MSSEAVCCIALIAYLHYTMTSSQLSPGLDFLGPHPVRCQSYQVVFGFSDGVRSKYVQWAKRESRSDSQIFGEWEEARQYEYLRTWHRKRHVGSSLCGSGVSMRWHGCHAICSDKFTLFVNPSNTLRIRNTPQIHPMQPIETVTRS